MANHNNRKVKVLIPKDEVKSEKSEKSAEKRPFPNVNFQKETALILFREGYNTKEIEIKLKTGKSSVTNWKRNDPDFKIYWDEVEWEIQEEIRSNSVNIARNFHTMIERVSQGEFDKEHFPQILRLAYDYLKQTGRFPKYDMNTNDEKQIEEAVQSLSNILVDKYGPDFVV